VTFALRVACRRGLDSPPSLRHRAPRPERGRAGSRPPAPARRSGRRPPAYVATAGFDPLRDEAEAYALRLREAGLPVALRRHPGLVHAFVNLTAISPTARAAMLEACGALRMGLAA
jgi:acetyl esterase/lipase